MSGPDLLTRTVMGSYRLVGAAFLALQGILDGLWLAVLDDRRLARLDAAYYDRHGKYRDEDYNRRGLLPWEQHAVETYFPLGGRVTVVGAGGGREVLALLARGFEATGFEPHPGLAAFGASLTSDDGHGVRVHHSPREGWPSAAPAADAVVVGWGAYMLIPGRERRIAYLCAARATLPVGGRILLSFFPRRGTSVRFQVSHRIGRLLVRSSQRRPVEPGDALVPNYVHYFTRKQVTAELREAGLRPLEISFEDYGWAVAEVEPYSDGASRIADDAVSGVVGTPAGGPASPGGSRGRGEPASGPARER